MPDERNTAQGLVVVPATTSQDALTEILRDGSIGCDDWGVFLYLWTSATDPPEFAPCTIPIAAASGWGLLVMALAVPGGGAWVLRGRSGALPLGEH